MRVLNKILVGSLLSLTCILQANAQTINNEKFLKDYQNIVRSILNEYNNPNLDAQIFDINNKNFLDFLQNSTKYQKDRETDIMAMQYYRNFKVRGKETAFCFILYDSKSRLIENYIANSNLNLDEITEYLALHEMGHCLVMDYLIKSNGDLSDKKRNERHAEIFALYLLHHTGKHSLVDKILKQNKIRDKDAIHYSYEELNDFVSKLRNNDITPITSYENLIQEIINNY